MITVTKPAIEETNNTILFEEINIKVIRDKREGIDIKEISAKLSFGVFDSNGNRVDNLSIVYTGEDYNNFWMNFNTGRFIYSELIASKGLTAEIPENIETEFVNNN